MSNVELDHNQENKRIKKIKDIARAAIYIGLTTASLSYFNFYLDMRDQENYSDQADELSEKISNSWDEQRQINYGLNSQADQMRMVQLNREEEDLNQEREILWGKHSQKSDDQIGEIVKAGVGSFALTAGIVISIYPELVPKRTRKPKLTVIK